jgi:putative ABC transport system permease protein
VTGPGRRGAGGPGARPGRGRRGRRGVGRLLTGEAGAGPVLALFLVTLIAAFVLTAGPREVTAAQASALRQKLAQVPNEDTGIAATAQWQTFRTRAYSILTPRQAATVSASLAAAMSPPADSPQAQRWSDMTTPFQPVLQPPRSAVLSGPPSFELAYRTGVAAHARLISGSLPGSVPRGGIAADGLVRTLGVAVTRATASRFGLRTGSVLKVAPTGLPVLRLKVTGIIRAQRPGSAFWQQDPVLAVPALEGPGDAQIWQGGAFVGHGELTALQAATSGQVMQATWFFPLSFSALTPDQLPQLLAEMAGLQASGVGQSAESRARFYFQTPPAISTDLSNALAGFASQQQAVAAVDSLLVGGLFAAGLILLIVSGGVAATAYRPELALVRARGGSTWQVAARMLARTCCLTLPAVAAGALLAVVAVPAGGNQASWILGCAVAAAGVGAAPAICAWTHRKASNAEPGRGDLVTGRPSARRAVAEITVVTAAAAAIVALRFRGVTTGSDLYTSASPLLVAVAAALVVARLYPVPVRALLGVASRQRGPVAFLALARAARTRLGAILPALALVLTLTLAAFCVMVLHSVDGAQSATAWQQVGANAVVQAPGNAAISPRAEHAIARAQGVRHTALVYTATADSAFAPTLLLANATSRSVGLVVVSPRSYAALAASTPWPGFPAGVLGRGSAAAGGGASAVPVLLSVDLERSLARSLTIGRPRPEALNLGGIRMTIRAAGVIGDTPAMPAGGSYVVLPSWAEPRFPSISGPDLLLATGPAINAAAFRAAAARAVPGGQLTLREQVLRALQTAPAQRVGERLYALGIWAAAVFSVLAVAFGLAATARGRTRLGERLSALGMPSRQSGALAMSEALPLVAVAALGTLAAGFTLALVIGPVLNLAVFSGSAIPVPVRPELSAMLIPAAGTALVAAAIVAVEGAVSRKRDVGAALRREEAR